MDTFHSFDDGKDQIKEGRVSFAESLAMLNKIKTSSTLDDENQEMLAIST